MNNIQEKGGRRYILRGAEQAVSRQYSSSAHTPATRHIHIHAHTHTTRKKPKQKKQESPKQLKTKEQYNESSGNVALALRSEPGAEKSIELNLTFRSTRGESRAKLKSTSV